MNEDIEWLAQFIVGPDFAISGDIELDDYPDESMPGWGNWEYI